MKMIASKQFLAFYFRRFNQSHQDVTHSRQDVALQASGTVLGIKGWDASSYRGIKAYRLSRFFVNRLSLHTMGDNKSDIFISINIIGPLSPRT